MIELTAWHHQGQRLDQYLVAQFPDHSRSTIQRTIESGDALVNGKTVKPSYKVRHGDQITVEFPPPLYNDEPPAEDIPLEVLYEDEWLAVINKPADMVVHPAKGNWRGTLVNALRFHFEKLSGVNGEYRSGIVHRLDRDTTGVIVIAKDEQVHSALGIQFEMREIYKEYHALTAGVLDRDSDYIERRIKKHPHDRVKMAVTDDEEEGKSASTFYEVIERFRGYTYCRVHPKTGRTHQIRVHLGSVGCPVLADKVYGGRDRIRLSELCADVSEEEDVELITRQALHAHRLRFTHPKTQETLDVQAPLPEDFLRLLNSLREHCAAQ